MPVRRTILTRQLVAAVAPPSGGGGFQTPDILNEASFETDLHPFLDLSDNYPPTGVSQDNTLAAPSGGTHSLKCPLLPNPGGDSGAACQFPYGAGYDRLWTRFFFRFTIKIDSHLKFWRESDQSLSNQMGGVWVTQGNPGLSFCFDFESNSLEYSVAGTDGGIYDSNWHSFEFDYMRNGTGADGSTWPNAEFWLDGVHVTHADGALPGQNSTAYWKNNRIYAGGRGSSLQMARAHIVGTLNGGNTQTGQVNIDRVCVSSLGRIGP